jgi:hypothetical protein
MVLNNQHEDHVSNSCSQRLTSSNCQFETQISEVMRIPTTKNILLVSIQLVGIPNICFMNVATVGNFFFLIATMSKHIDMFLHQQNNNKIHQIIGI